MEFIERDSSNKWHAIKRPKSIVYSEIDDNKEKLILQKFNLKIKIWSIEVRIYEGYDFRFKPINNVPNEFKNTIVSLEKDFCQAQKSSINFVKEGLLGLPDHEFDDLLNFFEDEDEINIIGDQPVFDKNGGYIRKSKRKIKKYLAIAVENMEISYIQWDENDLSIESQVGFTIENILWNEIKNVKKYKSIFDNDLDSHKNIAIKIIFLDNKEDIKIVKKKKKIPLEIYIKMESIKINFSHLSITFLYLMAERILLL